ncbi:MAG: adenylate/guanylate cyclase domain-containing protein [Longimicrobiales bacterium]
MKTRAKVTLEGTLSFAVAGVLFGLLYNTLFYPRTFVEYAEAGAIGLLLGTAAGVAEQAFLERLLRRMSFAQTVAIRTLLYSAFTAVSLSLVLSIEPATLGECTYLRCLADFLAGPLFVRDLVFSTLFVFLAASSVQVVLLVGTRNFGRLVLGKYRRPRELHAVFMFVDLRNSTGIAEQLGHQQFSGFLSEFFTQISGAIHDAKGEVYQYVGDEVVIVWPGGGRGSPTGWLACYNDMQASIQETALYYRERYGAVPEFKAGAHCGLVMMTEVGTLQRAHVYHGDVLNTASRIQGMCNEMGYDLLVSGALAATLDSAGKGEFDPLGSLPLRGKGEEVLIFGYRASLKRER